MQSAIARPPLERDAPAGPYAPPRRVTCLDDCVFYHTMDIPGYGTVEGPWDLRAGVREYLGGVDLRGKRVLELGTASGYLCFHMEQQGAEVVGYDVTATQAEEMNVVPYARTQRQGALDYVRRMIAKLNNSWWLCHRAFGSAARVVYGNIYAVPAAIGPVDVATFGSILLHLRDPFQALASALPLVRETVIITEPLCEAEHPTWNDPEPAPSLAFQPNYRTAFPPATWWSFSPEVLRRFLGVLGFEETAVTYHAQLFKNQRFPMFTVVGRRTAPRTPAAWHQ